MCDTSFISDCSILNFVFFNEANYKMFLLKVGSLSLLNVYSFRPTRR